LEYIHYLIIMCFQSARRADQGLTGHRVQPECKDGLVLRDPQGYKDLEAMQAHLDHSDSPDSQVNELPSYVFNADI